MPSFSTGEEIKLDFSGSARKRIVCGLSWGTTTGSGYMPGDMQKKGTRNQDLDLICLTFDKFGGFIDGVTGEEGYRSGDHGNIYHTGDATGSGDAPDEEQIALELFNLSSRIHQVFLIAEVQSGQNFEDVTNPYITLSNPMDESDMVSLQVGAGIGAKKNAFVFGCIHRSADGWMFRYIGDYLDGAEVGDWASALRRHLEIIDPDKGTRHEAVTPEKGETVRLRYSPVARHRILCGLNWDPNEDESSTPMDRLRNKGRNIDTTDLDLACVMYNAKLDPVDGVSAKPDETSGAEGKVYHSGDHVSGEGAELDDETISVELRGLSTDIYHIVFLAEIQSEHTFSEINNPYIRLADGKTNQDQLVAAMNDPEGADKTAYVFARISRQGETWMLTFIDDYLYGAEVEDWIEQLRSYLA